MLRQIVSRPLNDADTARGANHIRIGIDPDHSSDGSRDVGQRGVIGIDRECPEFHDDEVWCGPADPLYQSCAPTIGSMPTRR